MSSDECQGKDSWPELVGKDGNYAQGVIEEENKRVDAIIVLEGSSVIGDFRCDRVWVWVDEDGKVVDVPKIG